MTKKMLDYEQHVDFATGIEAEAQAQAICMQHPDFREAHDATWLIERHGFRPPPAVGKEQLPPAALAASAPIRCPTNRGRYNCRQQGGRDDPSAMSASGRRARNRNAAGA